MRQTKWIVCLLEGRVGVEVVLCSIGHRGLYPQRVLQHGTLWGWRESKRRGKQEGTLELPRHFTEGTLFSSHGHSLIRTEVDSGMCACSMSQHPKWRFCWKTVYFWCVSSNHNIAYLSNLKYSSLIWGPLPLRNTFLISFQELLKRTKRSTTKCVVNK